MMTRHIIEKFYNAQMAEFGIPAKASRGLTIARRREMNLSSNDPLGLKLRSKPSNQVTKWQKFCRFTQAALYESYKAQKCNFLPVNLGVSLQGLSLQGVGGLNLGR